MNITRSQAISLLVSSALIAFALMAQAPLPSPAPAGNGGSAGTCGALSGDITGTCASNALNSKGVTIPNASIATTQASGDGTAKVSTDAFIANALQSINPATSVQVSTTTVLPNTPMYSNGTAGVGATLTAGSNTTLAAIDGYSVLLGDRILVQNQVTTANNGCYTLTATGSGGAPWVLTRCVDYNSPTNINYTGLISTLQTGSMYAADTGFNLANLIATVGTSAITYNQAASGSGAGKPGGGVNFTGNTTPGDLVVVGNGASGKNIKDFGSAPATCSAPQFLQTISSCVTPVLTENSQSTAYGLILGDAGKMILHPATDNNARTFTIPANSGGGGVAFPTGTCVTFVNMVNTVTIAITSDTMTLMGANTTGTRTLAVGNWATACKIDSTDWVIGGSSGLT